MSIHHEPNGKSVVPRDHADREEPAATAGRLAKRYISIWGGNLLMAIVIGVGVLGLALFGSHLSQEEQTSASAERGGSGVIAWAQTTEVWISRPLNELTKGPTWSGSDRDHEEIKRALERTGQDGRWYALVVRAHQVNGHSEDMLFVRRPHRDADHLAELVEILDAAAESRRGDGAADLSIPSIHVLSDEMLSREPATVMAELLGYPQNVAQRERAGISGQ